MEDPLSCAVMLLVPRRITGSYLSRLARRALRNGAWRSLTLLERAWLRAASRIPVLRSKTAVELARRIALKVELATARGKAVLLGALEAARRGLSRLLSSYQDLLILGLSILNHPILHYTETPEERLARALAMLGLQP